MLHAADKYVENTILADDLRMKTFAFPQVYVEYVQNVRFGQGVTSFHGA